MARNAKILIVEDDPILALDLEDRLLEAGYEVAGTAGSVNDGLELIERDELGAATLDYQLGEETSEAIAAALDERNIPYCFISGRGDLIEGRARRVLRKPAAPRVVLREVERMLEAGRAA